MQYSSCVKSSDYLVFLRSQNGGCRALLFSFGSMGLEEAAFGKSFVMCPIGAAERTKLVVQTALTLLRCQFAI